MHRLRRRRPTQHVGHGGSQAASGGGRRDALGFGDSRGGEDDGASFAGLLSFLTQEDAYHGQSCGCVGPEGFVARARGLDLREALQSVDESHLVLDDAAGDALSELM